VIANERFREKEAGYHLYNISRGIHTTDMASWFSRWIKAQDFEQTRSFVRWTYEKRPRRRSQHAPAVVLGTAGLGFLVAMTILSYDWYGFANALSMASSVFVRHYMCDALRDRIDKVVEQSYMNKIGTKDNVDNHKSSSENSPENGWHGTPQKLLIITQDARAVAMLIPAEFMAPPYPFIANLKPENPGLYTTMRFCGWISFAVQVVTIGMSDLATQLVTVFLLVVPTVLFVKKLGCDDSHLFASVRRTFLRSQRQKVGTKGDAEKQSDLADRKGGLRSSADGATFEHKYDCWIGNYLKAEVYEWPPSHHYNIIDGKFHSEKDHHNRDKRSDKRQHLYAWLQLTVKETDSMDKWDLFPHRRGEDEDQWFNEYKLGKAEIGKIAAAPGFHGIRKLVPWTDQDEENDFFAEARSEGANIVPATGQSPVTMSSIAAHEDSAFPSHAIPAGTITGHSQQQVVRLRSTQPAGSLDPTDATVPPSSALFVSQETRARRSSLAPTVANRGGLVTIAAHAMTPDDVAIDSRPSTAASEDRGQHRAGTEGVSSVSVPGRRQ
jgi:hypothetical protein